MKPAKYQGMSYVQVSRQDLFVDTHNKRKHNKLEVKKYAMISTKSNNAVI